MAKNKKEKTPLQDAKKSKIEGLKEQEQETKEETKPGVAPEPKKRRKRKPKYVPPTPEESAVEALAFIDLCSMMRKQMGIKASVPGHYQDLFCKSYHMLILKYGPTMVTWMPEVFFGMTVFLIGYDTLVELRKIKIAEAKEQEAKEVKEKVIDITPSQEGEDMKAEMELPTDTAKAVNE